MMLLVTHEYAGYRVERLDGNVKGIGKNYKKKR